MSFLSFTGENEKNEDDSYAFVMEGNKGGKWNKTYDIVFNIKNPIIDYNFEKVFGKKENITKSLLNSLLYPNSNDIIEVEFLPLELTGITPEFNEKVFFLSLDSLRVDILCKCKLKYEIKEEENIQKKEDEKEQQKEEKDYSELQFEKDEIINEINGIDEYANELEDFFDLENNKISEGEKKGGKNKKNKT